MNGGMSACGTKRTFSRTRFVDVLFQLWRGLRKRIHVVQTGGGAGQRFRGDAADKMTREQIAQAEKLACEWSLTTQLPRL
jgi:hypothetical protein